MSLSARKKLENFVLCRCEENTGAAGLAPDKVIDAVSVGADVIAGIKLLVIDDQFAV